MMKKLFKSIVVIILLTLIIVPFFSLAYALEYTLDDSGIQTINQDYVPHISKTGTVQYQINDNSFFPLVINPLDVGPVPDENGTPQGTMWKKYNLNPTLSRNTLPDVKAASFNTAWPGWTPNQYELKLFNQFGLKIFPALESLYPAWTDPNVNNNEWKLLKDQVNSLKNDPSILGWYLFDDRDDLTTFGANRIWEMSYVYAAIKSIDPDRIVFPTISGPQNGAPLCTHHAYSDVFSVDELWTMSADTDLRYLLQTSGVNDCYKRGAYVTYNRKPLFISVQAVRYADRMPVMPSPAQIRAEMYTAIAGGATGIWIWYQHNPWSWGGGYGIPYNVDTGCFACFSGVSVDINRPQWDAISTTNREIETYKKVFLSRTAKDEYHVSNQGGTVITMLKDAGDFGEANTRYLLAVNTENKPKDILITFTNSTLYNGKVVSLFDNKVVVKSQSGFSDTFEFYGVRLYKITMTIDNDTLVPILPPVPPPINPPTKIPPTVPVANFASSVDRQWDKLEGGSTAIVTSNSPNIAIIEVSLDVINSLANAEISVSALKKNTLQTSSSSKVYQYLEFSKTNIADVDVANIMIKFKVAKSWLLANNVQEDDILLFRYSNETWNSLTTSKISNDDNYVNYEASTPGFSTFAIGAREKQEQVIKSINESSKLAEPVQQPLNSKKQQERQMQSKNQPRKPLFSLAVVALSILALLIIFVIWRTKTADTFS